MQTAMSSKMFSSGMLYGGLIDRHAMFVDDGDVDRSVPLLLGSVVVGSVSVPGSGGHCDSVSGVETVSGAGSGFSVSGQVLGAGVRHGGLVEGHPVRADHRDVVVAQPRGLAHGQQAG